MIYRFLSAIISREVSISSFFSVYLKWLIFLSVISFMCIIHFLKHHQDYIGTRISISHLIILNTSCYVTCIILSVLSGTLFCIYWSKVCLIPSRLYRSIINIISSGMELCFFSVHYTHKQWDFCVNAFYN